MKINLSLTEMSQFFMKMAEAVKKKKLKPGASIPGCNSYFLCKFLKDTMLQARCATWRHAVVPCFLTPPPPSTAASPTLSCNTLFVEIVSSSTVKGF